MWRALAPVLAVSACTLPKPDVDPSVEGVGDVEPPAAFVPATSCATAELSCPGTTITSDAAATPSCCETRWVPGGAFKFGFSQDEVPQPEDLPPERRERDTRVRGFFLDRFEVTVGRFLRFAAEYLPGLEAGAGAHPRIEGSGWNVEWNALLPADTGALLQSASCGAPSDPSSSEGLGVVDAGMDSLEQVDGVQNTGAGGATRAELPMGCLSWYVAFAFCVWDGGRLPTESEWEFAAAGGAQNRAFPWGIDSALSATLGERRDPVGSSPGAAGRYGQDDLAGSVQEWVLDWINPQRPRCDDCADLRMSVGRGIRGAADSRCCPGFDTQFHAAARNLSAPGLELPEHGVRCARDATPSE